MLRREKNCVTTTEPFQEFGLLNFLRRNSIIVNDCMTEAAKIAE